MIERIIQWSLDNRVVVLLLMVLIIGWGGYVVKNTPVDAIPDLSDVQVIIKTSYPGQAPQVVEQQVTYPLSTAMLSVPGAKTVRGFSFFGDSYVYVIFEDDTDLYWARSRVLEYLNQTVQTLPSSASSSLGPDATGVGWVYIYALQSTDNTHDISHLKSLQDWFLKYELQAVEGVSEVASVGGMVKQYQVTVQPEKLRAFNIPLIHIQNAIVRANQEVGASVVEMAEAEYMVKASGYIQSLKDLANIPLGVNVNGTPLLLQDVAKLSVGPQMRRGVAELNGEGETVGGIVVMRHGGNAKEVITNVKAKLEQLKLGLPAGVKITPVYDRSKLIKAAVKNLWVTLVEEILIVALVCFLFLWRIKSALVAIISLPVGIVIAFIAMRLQGVNANIMSLGGIAIAIGAMIDGAIVMIENFHRNLETPENAGVKRVKVVAQAAKEVGPSLFFSLLIITVSFTPVFALEAQEGRMFTPLALTKTYSMAAAAILCITLIPVLMATLITDKPKRSTQKVVPSLLIRVYQSVIRRALNWPRLVVVVALIVLASAIWPIKHLGSEFMPPLNEGSLMYMPTTYPSISIGKARALLQQTDKLIAQVPEVESVFGKVGRADTATDPAPLTMIETFIEFKPKNQWRPGVTSKSLKAELEALVDIPGLSNAWVMPIKTRIDMLSTGIKTPVGIKISGPSLREIEKIGISLEGLLNKLPGTVSIYSERVTGGRYLDIQIDRVKAARFGLNIQDVQQVITTAIGGMNVSHSVEGLERYPINLRYPQHYRDSPEQIALLPIVTPGGAIIALGDVASVVIANGPPSIKSENARINGWTLIDIDGVDLGSYVVEAQKLIKAELDMPVGYSLSWSGQYEYMERAKERLIVVIPLTLTFIILLLYLCFRRVDEVLIVLGTLPLALIGGLWGMYWLGFNLSVAAIVGFIALAGVSIEIGVIMLMVLNQSVAAKIHLLDNSCTRQALLKAVLIGATARIRPIVMTTAATILGLIPIMFSAGVGSEVMQRLAAPMIGGMISAFLLSLFVLPCVYLLWNQRKYSGLL